MDSRWYQVLAVGALYVVFVSGLPTSEDRRLTIEEEDDKAARNAKYHFSSNVQDGINDLTQERQETRDGLDVKGFYSYSDGYVRRKIEYVADENGYRVVSEEVEKLPGPMTNQSGVATVDTLLGGFRTRYGVQSVPTEYADGRAQIHGSGVTRQ